MLSQEIGANTGYERIGGLELFESEAARERATAQVELQERYGIRSRLIDRDELRDLEPDLSDRVVGAVFCPDDGAVDHAATTRGLAAAAKHADAAIFEDTPAARFERSGDRVSAVVSGGERFEAARAVVLLANSGAGELLASLQIDLPLARVFPQILLTERVPGLRVTHLVGHLERRAIVKQVPDGELMISGGWLGRWNDATQRGEAIDANVRGNFAEACELFPAIRNVAVIQAFADRAEAFRPELLPIIDRAPGLANVIVGTGWSGHGFAIAPAVSRLLARWLLEGEKPAELAPFRWRC